MGRRMGMLSKAWVYRKVVSKQIEQVQMLHVAYSNKIPVHSQKIMNPRA